MSPEAPRESQIKMWKDQNLYCSSSARTSTSLPGFKIFSFKIDLISPGLLETWTSCLEPFYVFNLVVFFFCFQTSAQFPLQLSRTLKAVKRQKCFVGLQTFHRHGGAGGQRCRFNVGGQKRNVWRRPRRAPPLVQAAVGGCGFNCLQVWGRGFAPQEKWNLQKKNRTKAVIRSVSLLNCPLMRTRLSCVSSQIFPKVFKPQKNLILFEETLHFTSSADNKTFTYSFNAAWSTCGRFPAAVVGQQRRQQLPWCHTTPWHHQTAPFVFIYVIERLLLFNDPDADLFGSLLWEDTKLRSFKFQNIFKWR